MPDVSPKRYFTEWQLPFIAQFAQPQPQEDFPFFLSRTILPITAATTAISTAQITTVATFPVIHDSIAIPPLFRCSYCFCQLGSLLIRSENHIKHEDEDRRREDQTDNMQISREG